MSVSAPKALFDPAGRKRLAHLLVWGSNGLPPTRDRIQARIEEALRRVAEKVAPKKESA